MVKIVSGEIICWKMEKLREAEGKRGEGLELGVETMVEKGRQKK